MAYSFRASDNSVEQGLCRIAISQLESGLEELCDDSMARSAKVHAARKRCKKMRGLVRFVRCSFDDYSGENKIFRDAARTLSDARDATALLATADALETHFSKELKKAALNPLRDRLETKKAALDDDEIESRLADMVAVFENALERVKDWSLGETGPDAFTGGVAKTYDRARKAMAKARKTGKADDFHAWRKRVKYHRYHARLAKRIWRPVLDGRVEEADALSDDLGDHHDLAVLTTAAKEALGPDAETAELVEGLARARQAQIEASCFERGEKLFSEKGAALAERWEGWWRAGFQ
ncbi:MAG: CHAD domain-containing protein [Henriciella sp.]|uniref:CHAD domain-containing protein n=1 Tax=Henriciella sp. TaxID=1968823 RepID=UPI003C763FD1